LILPQSATCAETYYVDGDHPVARDTNPGTQAQPWKTIAKATPLLQPGDTLFIKEGIYRETIALTRSGTPSSPITIAAYPGHEGKVVINAAQPVTQWHKCAGPDECAGNPYWRHIYAADVGAEVQSHPHSAFAVRQVFQDGERLKRSRYPNVGWRYPTSIPDPKKTFSDSSLSKPDEYFAGSVCHVKTSVWHIDQIPITDFSQGRITLAGSPRFDISTRFGYYITSVVGEINEEGEWAYDPGKKKLFLWPRGGVAEGVEFTYRRYCVRTDAETSWNIVRGLALHNAYRHGVLLYHANDMTIENNIVENTFMFGIYLQTTGGTCNNNRILNNTVRHSCFRGISVGGDASHCRVEGNYVYATGTEHFGGDLTHGPSHAVYIAGPFARVYNNRIDRAGYTALYLEARGLGREVCYNYITNIGLALSDGGGIYTGSFHNGPEEDHIHHNIIEDAIGCLSMIRRCDKGLPVTIEKYSGDTPGIYVDEEGNNRIIEHNTVINSHMAGILFHWAPSNVVRDNTLYGNRKCQIWLSGKNSPRKILENDELYRNILFATDADQQTLLIALNYNNVKFGQSDDNHFYNPYYDKHVFVSRYDSKANRWIREKLTLREWRESSGYDENSREFSYLDQLDDVTIDRQRKPRIVYNASLDVAGVDLKSAKYCDVRGNRVYGSISLQPFESMILIPAEFEIPERLSQEDP
jgi:parallel beta-helix repeat protein